MAALDTLYFDLKINDLTESQMKAIKSRLEKELGQGLDIGKNIKQSIDNANVKVKIGADTSVVEGAIKRVKELMNQPSMSASDKTEMVALSRVIKNVTEDKVKMARADEIAMRSADAHTIAQERLAAAALRTEKAQQSLANANSRAAQSAGSHINANVRLGQSMTGLISISGDLRNQIGMLVSAYTVEHLLKNVVEIGGEFEKQKLAMGSMLGSLEQADDIFNRMKNLALTSPFNFKDLSNYSRQLTAFGTPYKDLYDTTNRLADISAGLGGDMSRLVLAFSQVKAAAYLRGQEMRQFTEFGVSLPDLLAKKYTEAEGRIVTAGDVIERVSKRMVSFNDVKDVLWKSTDKGGQFYGMQDVLAQSTSGMASNLKDAIDTMYYDIANSKSGVIKGTIKDITKLVSHWRELSSALGAATILWGAHRIAMAAHNRIIGQGTAETLKGVMASKQEEASVLRRKALYGELSAAEKERLATVNVLTASDFKLLATSKSVNADQAIRLVNGKKITAEMAMENAETLMLSSSQLQYVTKLHLLNNTIETTTGKTRLMAIAERELLIQGKNVQMGLSGLWTSLKGLFTLPNLLMTGAFIGLDLWMNYKQKQEQMAQERLQFMKDTEDGAKSLNDFIKANPIELVIKKGNEDEIKKAIDSYKEQLQNSPLDMSGIITNAEAIDNDVKKLEELKQAVIDLKNAKEAASNTGSIVAGAMDKQDDLFSESAKTNYEDMVKSFSNVSLNMSNITKGEITKTLEYLKNIPSLRGLSSQFDEIKNSGGSVVDMMMQLAKVNEQADGTIQIFIRQSENYKNVLSGLGDAKSYLVDANTFWQQIQKGLNDTTSAYMANGIFLKHTSQQNIDQYLIEVDAQGKSLGLQGDNLVKYRLMAEQNLDIRDNMKNHAQAWQLLFEEVKNQLIKSKTPIENASKENVIAAEKIAINHLRSGQFGSQLNEALNYISSNLNPIAIRLQIMGGSVNANTLYNDMLKRWRDKKGAPSLAPSAWMPTSENIDEYRKTLDSQLKTAKEHLDTTLKHYGKGSSEYNKALEDYNNGVFVQSLAGFSNDTITSKYDKKTGGGSKEDTFLKDMRARLDQVKKAMDEYKKWIQAGKSESSAIVDVESMGIFAKGTFSKMSTESELNAWYKRTIKNLEDMMRKNKPSTERKKFLNEILSNLTDFDRDDFKRSMDSKSQFIEEELRKLSKKWSLYNSLYGETGNRELSGRIAFGANGNSFNTASEEILARISNISGLKDSAQKIVAMSDSQIKAIYSGEVQSELIKYVASYKSYLESEESEKEKMYADSIKSTMGYYEKLQQIETEYDRKIEIARAKGDNTTASRLQGQKQSKIDAMNPDYALFYQSALMFTKDRARELANVLRENLARDFKNGAISAKDYAETLEKINKQLDYSEKRKSYFASYQEGGFDELFKKMFEEGSNKILQGSTQYKSGVDLLNSTNDTNKQQDALVQMTQGQKTMAAGNNIMQAASKAQGAIAVVDKIVKMIDQIIQALKQAFDSIAEMADSYGHNTDKGGWLTAKTAISGLSEFSSKAKAGWDSLKNGDIAGAISNNISAYASIFTNFNKYHDKKLDNKIQDLGQQITEENLLLKTIEDKLKYHLGNAANDSFLNSMIDKGDVDRARQLQNSIAQIQSKGKLNFMDKSILASLNAELDKYTATLKYLETGNVYNYQRDLYKQQLEQIKQQKQAEEDKKKTDQSKINDYNSQIEEMETKIAQFSLDLANSLYGIDIKGWASQLGDALFEAWQKGESGADAFKKKANDIIASVANKWATQRIIEPAMQKLMDDMVGKDGQGGWLGADNDMSMADMINSLAPDILGVQTSIDTYNKAMTALNEGFKKQGINMQNTSSSSTANAISGVTEQEANIIASYMDAIRQDTYNNRMNLQKMVDEGIKVSESPIMRSQLQQLQSIASNTYKNMELVGEIKSMFYDITIGNKKIYIN